MANEMQRALGYLVQVQEDLRAAEELLARVTAGRAMAMKLIEVSIELSQARPARRGGVVQRARKFDDPGALGAA